MGTDIFGGGSHSGSTNGGGFNDPDQVRAPNPSIDQSPINNTVVPPKDPEATPAAADTLYPPKPITPVDTSAADALNNTKNNETRDISRKRYDNAPTSSKRSTLLTGLLGLSDNGISGTKKSLLGL